LLEVTFPGRVEHWNNQYALYAPACNRICSAAPAGGRPCCGGTRCSPSSSTAGGGRAFTALRYFALDGTDHESHREQASMIRRYITWRNRHVTDPKLRKVIRRVETIERANVA
jgi:hypothetical protein